MYDEAYELYNVQEVQVLADLTLQLLFLISYCVWIYSRCPC